VRAVAIALLLAVSATTARADDDPLAQAIALEAQLQYEPALAIVERAIVQGGADHDRLVTLHMFAGKLAAGLDRPAVAEDHFARVLALAPDQKFADGTSPKITEPFDRARTRTAPLRISAEIKPDAITIVPEADPLGLVAGIAVTLDGGRELREMQKRRVAIPAGARATEVFALDTFGNRVWSQPVTATTTTHVEHPTNLRPLYQRWPFWASATFVALAAGGVSAWRFTVAQDDWNELKRESLSQAIDYSELRDAETRGRRWALAANISFSVAAATTLVAIITAARGSTTTAVVTAQPDSVGFAIAGGF